MTNLQIDREVVHLCLGDGTQGVRQMIGDVSSLVDQLRRHDLAPAHVAMAQLAKDMGALIVLVESLRGPVSALAPTVLPSHDDVEQMATSLEAVVTAQAGQDWLTVSDLLEYDVEPALDAWLIRFESATAAVQP